MDKGEDLRPLSSFAATRTPGEPDKTFKEQLDAYAYGDLPSGDMLLVARNAAEAGLPEAGDLPILMKQKTLRKIQADHDIPLSQLDELPNWIKAHPLAMESITEPSALVVVADAIDIHGNEIIVTMHLDVERREIQLNEISSIYGKRNLAYLIENTLELSKEVYTNERTGDWIQRAGLPLPERIANRLCNHYTTEETSLDALIDEVGN